MFSKNNQDPSKKPASTTLDSGKKVAPATRNKSANAPSILSRDLIVTGEISTDGDVQIEGRLEGNIKATTLTIGEQGAVNGKINAGKVLIRGKVTGKINANSIEMAETANVLADLEQDHLIIANGAFFDGKCTRKSKPSSAPASTPVAKAKEPKS